MTIYLLCLIGISILAWIGIFLIRLARAFRDEMDFVHHVRRNAWPKEGHTLHFFKDLKNYPSREDMQ